VVKPSRVSVLGYEMKIVYAPIGQQPEALDGNMTFDDRTITIDTKLVGKQLEDTLLHEIIHAILHISGLAFLLDDKSEEAVVRALEHGLSPLVKLNIPKAKK
jgi:ssRNA-specific RNase YbeY (16S rRNA maturation enzyme)